MAAAGRAVVAGADAPRTSSSPTGALGLDELARLLPPDLPLDTLRRRRVARHRRRSGSRASACAACRRVPRLSFAQLDIRTYVTRRRPARRLALLGRRVEPRSARGGEARPPSAGVPRPHLGRGDGRYEATRDGLSFAPRYRPAGEAVLAEPGSLEHFLTERYCLYTADGGRLYRAELHHPPWQLQPAEATIESATIAPVALEGEPHAALRSAAGRARLAAGGALSRTPDAGRSGRA